MSEDVIDRFYDRIQELEAKNKALTAERDGLREALEEVKGELRDRVLSVSALRRGYIHDAAKK